MALTGRFNLRKSFSGKIILQVEEELKSAWSLFSSAPKFRKRWRDAKPMDLAAAELRGLIDLRSRPRTLAESYTPTFVARASARQPEPDLKKLDAAALHDKSPAPTTH